MGVESKTSPFSGSSYVSILLDHGRDSSPEISSRPEQSPYNSLGHHTLRVVDFYENKTILITGATGFIGKVLVEKLLRSCPQLKRIYLILRKKSNKTPQQRLEEMIDSSPVFSFHREKLDFTKLQVVTGDMTEPGLGLSPADRKLLVEEVNVVFHSAALVQFQGKLNKFINQNIDGTYALMNLCQEMHKLKSIVYVSTAYANCHLLEIEEKVYPIDGFKGLPKSDSIEKFIEQLREKFGDTVTKEGDPVLMERPNAYTMSKSIAENLVFECFSHLPVTIYRPSIVSHAFREPVEGWCDSFNGISGLLVLGGLGIARNMNVDCDCKADLVPVDMVCNSLIITGAYTALFPEARQKVIHFTSGEINPITFGQILEYGRKSLNKYPSMKQARPLAPNPTTPRNKLELWYKSSTNFVSHYLFAILVDLILLLIGKRRFMWNLTQRMYRGFDVLEFFSSRQWCFRNRNYKKILSLLSPYERQLFASDIEELDWKKYVDALTLGSRRYLIKEDDSTIEMAKKRQKRLNLGWRIASVMFYILLIVFIFRYIL